MRNGTLAVAIALFLIAPLLGPGAAAYGEEGSIASPRDGAELQSTDVVRLTFTPSPLANTSTVRGEVRLDNVTIGTYTHELADGSNITVPVEVPSNMTSRNRTLGATFVTNQTAASAFTRVRYVGGPPNTPPTLEVHSASYVVGMGFRVSGSATDEEGIQGVSLHSRYASSWQWKPNASFTIDLPLVPDRLGHEILEVRATDGELTSRELLIVEVVGERVVLYERLVNMTLGAHAEVLTFQLPGRLLDGNVSIGCEGSDGPVGCLGGVNGVVDADVTLLECTYSDHAELRVYSTYGCPFSTRNGPGSATFTWTQASGVFTLRAAATRV